MPCQRILFVDDDPDLREMISILLEAAGFVVDTAENAEGALKKIGLGETFDLLITDHAMPPGMTGREMILALRSRGKCPPVIMLTAEQDQPASMGITVLLKPVSIALLLTAIDRKLGLPNQAAHPNP